MINHYRIALAFIAICAGGIASGATHPDLTGTWSRPFRVHSSGVPLMGGATRWMPVSNGDPKDAKIPSLDEMSAMIDKVVKANHGNPTAGFPPAPPAPLTAAGKQAAGQIDMALEEKRELNCYPANVLARVGGGWGAVQIVQNDKAIAILSEGGVPGRTLFLDGRGHDNAVPQWNGHSVARWEGDTLKVETVKIRGESVPMQGKWPLSENAKLLEEFKLTNGGKTLQVRATFEDPQYYAEPLRMMMYLDRRPDIEVTDYTCEEGKDDMIETALQSSGKTP